MQRPATELPLVEQLSFIAHEPASKKPDLEYIPYLQTTHDAMEYAMRIGRKVPKNLVHKMGKDKTVWSRILNGELDLPCGDIPKFNKAVGNTALLLHINHQCHMDITTLRPLRDDSQRRIAELEQKVADYERAFSLAFGKGRGS